MDKCAILCDKCLNMDVDGLAERIHGEVLRVDNCEQELNIDSRFDHVVFGCPALYHTSRYSGMYEIVDLRLIEQRFKKPQNIASAWINSSLITVIPHTEAVETGQSVIYVGSDEDIISELSQSTELTVITDQQTVEKLCPFHVRVIQAQEKEIDFRGRVGNFQVTVRGKDPIYGVRGEFTLKGGQLILPQELAEDREGIYSYANAGEEYRSALKLMNSLGGYTRIRPVEVHQEICATSKSGFKGCELCFSCPQNAISREKGRISISDACNGCGLCGAVCPLSAIEYTLLPSHKLLEKIDSAVAQNKTLAFVCDGALGELYGIESKKLPQISPVVVPCINAISEVHYLYAVLKGANVVVIPCENEHDFQCFNLAYNTLEAFGFDCLKVCSFEQLGKMKLKAKTPENILDNLEGRNKREQWLYMVEKLMAHHPLKKSAITTELFAMVEIDNACTLCMTCSNFCPTEAIKKENEGIYFNHGLCVACGLCATACPEGAINLEKLLDLDQLGYKQIYEDTMLCCPSCGKPHIPQSMYDKLSEVGEHSLLFCSECRPRIILESIYEEMVNEGKGYEDNE